MSDEICYSCEARRATDTVWIDGVSHRLCTRCTSDFDEHQAAADARDRELNNEL